MKAKRRVVYSTDGGNLCPQCRKPVAQCICKADSGTGDGIARLQRQTKGRNGKPVVVVSGLGLSAADMKQLASRLKAKCAVGGTVEGDTIVIQGDKRDIIRAELESLGYTVK
ncbi:MAG TPA: stress response translation initiation inhibitor YciH [Pseudomonadales bacterium]|nr:stress response translation initiation inhibitor YciH [Pseudomonadales bacterium]